MSCPGNPSPVHTDPQVGANGILYSIQSIATLQLATCELYYWIAVPLSSGGVRGREGLKDGVLGATPLMNCGLLEPVLHVPHARHATWRQSKGEA